MNRETVIYLAGFIDADGCISIGRHKAQKRKYPSYQPKLQVGSTSPEVLDLCRTTFGGNVWPDTSKHGNKAFYQWVIYGQQMRKALLALMPFLKLKKRQAEIALELHRRIEEYPKRIGHALSADEAHEREKLHQRLRGISSQLPLAEPFDLRRRRGRPRIS